MLSHDALRLDLADLQRLLDALAAQVAAGRPLKKWQLEAAQGAWRYHQHMLTVHHDTEEREQLDFVLGGCAGALYAQPALESPSIKPTSFLASCCRCPPRCPPLQSCTSRCCAPGLKCRTSRASTTSAFWSLCRCVEGSPRRGAVNVAGARACWKERCAAVRNAVATTKQPGWMPLLHLLPAGVQRHV